MKKTIMVLILLISTIMLGQETYFDALPYVDSVTTTVGSTTSAAIPTKGNQLFTIMVPSTFDGTTITIQSSWDGSTFYDIYDFEDGTVYSGTVTAGKRYALKPGQYFWIDKYIRIKSDVAAADTDDKFYYTIGKYFKK